MPGLPGAGDATRYAVHHALSFGQLLCGLTRRLMVRLWAMHFILNDRRSLGYRRSEDLIRVPLDLGALSVYLMVCFRFQVQAAQPRRLGLANTHRRRVLQRARA